MTIVIVAPASDAHARAVCERIGGTARILDTQRFPAEMRITLGERLEDVIVDGERLWPSAVYVRQYGLDPLGSAVAQRERGEVVMSIVQRWEQGGAAVYNPPSTRARVTKPYQLARLAAAGLPVPVTRWTNDPGEVRRFAAEGRVAYKPVAGGAATRELEARDLERLPRLASAPVCFQELLSGQDLRVYVLDGKVIASIRIDADALDFRGHETALGAYPLDLELERICVRAAEVIGLRFTGMDLKAGADGRLRILELNPSPMFLGFDAHAGSDILGALCAALQS